MKLALRVFAFSLCLVATYSVASFKGVQACQPKAQLSAPMPTCPPSNPHCSILP
jgi:hypothetical protein